MQSSASKQASVEIGWEAGERWRERRKEGPECRRLWSWAHRFLRLLNLSHAVDSPNAACHLRQLRLVHLRIRSMDGQHTWFVGETQLRSQRQKRALIQARTPAKQARKDAKCIRASSVGCLLCWQCCRSMARASVRRPRGTASDTGDTDTQIYIRRYIGPQRWGNRRQLIRRSNNWT